ncbi:uncharacterized protein BDR25DRAFT_291565 [Lindgomyces ingoldianus]|uniref:Uncharacterized protein n=1 Tax=Lindgomyces ingoldianus TaxID=673940 RepID=A0ACB6QM85_9PLEO|nr:uncharacterized protein BDR25DRAFT_291565 [Lindgomyces ingoldianus]KAF2467635.1 hypothetical protein BDR25DRAFT_291565 [Lindgomyces ingoldianus]
MDDGEDDDLYGPSETAGVSVEPKKHGVKDESDGEQGDEPMDEGLESGEEEESDSDLEIIIDRPQPAPKPSLQQPPTESKAIKIEQPPHPPAPASKPSTTTPSAAAHPQLPGTAYPAVRTSDLDVNADPVYPPTTKTITQIDMDADLAESTKPWRLPGADQSDYFNYGFDEFTWEMYRQRQASMAATLSAQKAETAQFQQMFMPGMQPPTAPSNPVAGGAAAGGGGGPGVPGAPTGPAAQTGGAAADMGGMPPGGMSQEQINMLMTQMQAQGVDMQNMDFGTFMQMAGASMGGFPGQPGGGGQYGGGGGQPAQGGGGGGGGGRGSGRRGGRW